MTNRHKGYVAALEEKDRLLRLFADDPGGVRLLSALGRQLGDGLPSLFMAGLRTGEAFFWDRPPCEMVYRAAPSMPSMALAPEDLVASSAFCHFSSPAPLGEAALVGFVWQCYGWDGYNLGPAPSTAGTGLFAFPLLRFPSSSRALPAFAALNWPFGTDWRDARPIETDRRFPPDHFRLIVAAFSFLSQRLLVTRRVPVGRERGQSTRDTPRHDPAIRVVMLRQAVTRAPKADAKLPVEWRCRWEVSGHWRQQPCGPAGRDRRPVWIAKYVKGPSDKPFKAKAKRLFAVVR